MDRNGVVSYPKPPKREPSQRERDSGKHCIFHDMDGHDTNDYRHLRDLIEERVRRGELPEYVKPSTAPALPPLAPRRGNDSGSSSRRLIIN